MRVAWASDLPRNRSSRQDGSITPAELSLTCGRWVRRLADGGPIRVKSAGMLAKMTQESDASPRHTRDYRAEKKLDENCPPAAHPLSVVEIAPPIAARIETSAISTARLSGPSKTGVFIMQAGAVWKNVHLRVCPIPERMSAGVSPQGAGLMLFSRWAQSGRATFRRSRRHVAVLQLSWLGSSLALAC